MPRPRGLVYVSQGNITREVWIAAGLRHGVLVVIPIHHGRTWAQPGTALTARFHLIEWRLNTGNKWPLLDTNSLFTSGCAYSGETLQQNEFNGISYISRMEMYYPEERGEDASFYFQQNGAASICFSAQKLWRWRSLLDYFFQLSLCSFAHCFYPSVEIIFLMDSITHCLF